MLHRYPAAYRSGGLPHWDKQIVPSAGEDDNVREKNQWQL